SGCRPFFGLRAPGFRQGAVGRPVFEDVVGRFAVRIDQRFEFGGFRFDVDGGLFVYAWCPCRFGFEHLHVSRASVRDVDVAGARLGTRARVNADPRALPGRFYALDEFAFGVEQRDRVGGVCDVFVGFVLVVADVDVPARRWRAGLVGPYSRGEFAVQRKRKQFQFGRFTSDLHLRRDRQLDSFASDFGFAVFFAFYFFFFDRFFFFRRADFEFERQPFVVDVERFACSVNADSWGHALHGFFGAHVFDFFGGNRFDERIGCVVFELLQFAQMRQIPTGLHPEFTVCLDGETADDGRADDLHAPECFTVRPELLDGAHADRVN